MKKNTKISAYMPTSRLSRRIVLWIFISVVVIEAIILIPSYDKRKEELLDHLMDISTARVSLIMQLMEPHASGDQILEGLKQLSSHPVILGGMLYKETGEKIGEFGEKPDLTFEEAVRGKMKMRLDSSGTRYDMVCPAIMPRSSYKLILRHDATSVKDELRAFILRISGLVLIISLFVTVGAWLALGPIVVTPVLKLRSDLIKAGEAVTRNEDSPEFDSQKTQRSDELGEVISAFNKMYHQITDAIAERRQAESALQESLNQVEEYSLALKNELMKGRKIQNNFLPFNLEQRPGWEIDAYFKPARQVAGDFYDIFELSNNRIGMVVADVCDKGVGAALFMALFRSLIRIFSGQTSLDGLECSYTQLNDTDNRMHNNDNGFQHLEVLRAVRLTNDYIAKNHGELAMFATLFFGVLELDTGKLSYVNGGHDPVIVLTPDGSITSKLKHTGPAVGLNEKTTFEIRDTLINPGEIIFAYTDGVVEARNENGDFYTMDRLITQMSFDVTSARAIVNRIKNDVLYHTGEADQFDDITMLAVRRKI